LQTQQYRWVKPPPGLAGVNEKPSGLVFTLEMGPNGVRGEPQTTADAQVTVVVPDGAVATHGGDGQVRFTVEPVDPGTLAPPGDGLISFGNAYRFSATYEPSGTEVSDLDKPIEVILVYPATVHLLSANHAIYSSGDGKSWTKRKGTDNLVMQQAEAKVPTLGYTQVAGVPAPSITPAPGTSSGSHGLKIALIVAAVCVLLIGVGLLLRSRSG
jgi:hypothetical protein